VSTPWRRRIDLNARSSTIARVRCCTQPCRHGKRAHVAVGGPRAQAEDVSHAHLNTITQTPPLPLHAHETTHFISCRASPPQTSSVGGLRAWARASRMKTLRFLVALVWGVAIAQSRVHGVVCVASIWLPRSANLLHAHPLACMLPAANTLDPLHSHTPLPRSHGCFRC
jgi:hypothetical protein